jgi:putative hemolysin
MATPRGGVEIRHDQHSKFLYVIQLFLRAAGKPRSSLPPRVIKLKYLLATMCPSTLREPAMRLHTATTLFTRTEALSLSLATTRKELREVQRLRYKVFVEAGGLDRLANDDRLDADSFDEHCDHLIVRDTVSLKVVGTYRLLHPAAARAAGQYYSESEFDLSRLDHLRSNMIEAGRACIHPKYRGGAVLMMLWSGLAANKRLRRCD